MERLARQAEQVWERGSADVDVKQARLEGGCSVSADTRPWAGVKRRDRDRT